MDNVTLQSAENIGRNFIPVDYLPPDKTYKLPAEHARWLTRRVTPENLAVTSQFISVLGSGFVQLFQEFHYSSLSIIIVIAIVALFLADRLFRRRSTIEISIL